jgi:trigger factor
MKIQVEDIGPVKKRVEVSIPEDQVARVQNQVVREVNRRAKIRGFRPGKVPRSILERHYGHDIERETTSRLIGETLEDVFNSQGIVAVTQPTLEKSERISEPGFGFRYALSVEVMPHVEPRDYAGMQVERPASVLSPEEVERELVRLQDQYALLRTIEEERPVQKGDLIIVDIEGQVEGRSFEGGRGENLLVEVGSGKLLPGLEEGLVGLRPHSNGEITVTFPHDFKRSQLAGKSAVFSVKVKELKQKILPALDDEFAREAGGVNTIQELREKIRQDLQQRADQGADEAVKKSILDQLRSNHPIELPPSMVEEEGQQIFRNLKIRLASQGAYAETEGLSDQEIKAACANEAQKHIHARIILKAIAKKEGLVVTEEEIQEELKKLARLSGTTVERLKRDLQERGAMESLRSRLLEEKTLDFLKEKATIKIEKN